MSRLSEVIGIGYQGRTLEDVLVELVERGVATLVDVRSGTRVAKNGFDRDHLSAGLAARGIDYRHEPALGNPSWNRAGFAHAGPVRQDAQHRYAALLGERPATAAMNRIWAAAHEGPVAVLCLEADEHACHRRILLEHLGRHLPVALLPNRSNQSCSLGKDTPLWRP